MIGLHNRKFWSEILELQAWDWHPLRVCLTGNWNANTEGGFCCKDSPNLGVRSARGCECWADDRRRPPPGCGGSPRTAPGSQGPACWRPTDRSWWWSRLAPHRQLSSCYARVSPTYELVIFFFLENPLKSLIRPDCSDKTRDQIGQQLNIIQNSPEGDRRFQLGIDVSSVLCIVTSSVKTAALEPSISPQFKVTVNTNLPHLPVDPETRTWTCAPPFLRQ